MTVAEARQRVEAFLTGQMVEALQAIEYRLPPFDDEPGALRLADALALDDPVERQIEIYCYALAEPDFLADELQQLYWRTDIVQMTRYFMLEMVRCGVKLAPVRRAAQSDDGRLA